MVQTTMFSYARWVDVLSLRLVSSSRPILRDITFVAMAGHDSFDPTKDGMGMRRIICFPFLKYHIPIINSIRLSSKKVEATW